MAQRTVTVSDLSGKPGADAVTFAVDGTAYVMDITAAEKRAFLAALQPYLDIAREVPARSATRPRGQAPKPVVQRIGRAIPEHLDDAPAPARKPATEKARVKRVVAKKAVAKKTAGPEKKAPAKKAPAKKAAPSHKPATTKSAAPAGVPAPAATVRAWANKKRIPVPDRGRIPADVMVKFEAAHPARVR